MEKNSFIIIARSILKTWYIYKTSAVHEYGLEESQRGCSRKTKYFHGSLRTVGEG